MNRKYFNQHSLLRIFLALFTFHFSLFTLSAQDNPSTNKPLLPFQQVATETTDEQLSMQLFQSHDYEKAAEVYERMYKKAPSYYIYTYYLQCLIEMRDYDKAEKLVKTARKNEQDALKYQVDLGYINYRQGNVDKARKIYDEALKKCPANVQQIHDLANAFTIRGENEYTTLTYLRGKELLGNTYPFSFELASIYERTGKLKEMINEYFELLEFNKTYLPTVQDRLQNSLADDPENIKNETFRNALLEKVRKEPDRSYYSELLWWYSIQQKDFELALIQAKALDRRLKEDGNRVFQLAQLCVSNKDFDAAIDGYEYLISKGVDCPMYFSSRIELLNTRMAKAISAIQPDKKFLLDLEIEYNNELNKSGITSRTLSLVKNLAHLEAFYLGKTDQASDLLEKTTELQDLPALLKADCKIELADILLFTNDPWEATLLYQQVYKDFKNDMIGQDAKFKNAKLSYYIGEFSWAETQLDVLKAATTKLIANDAMALSLLISENFDADSGTVALGYYAHADLLDYRNEEELAVQTLDSIQLAFASHTIIDEMLFKKAQIRMKQGRYTEGDTLLATIVKDYSNDVLADFALFNRGRLHEEQFKNKEKAMEFYQDLMVKYPGSIYAVDARKRFRLLRGDNVH
ncbi:MAG: tetratricopeptide repeat protein [Bacteroidota bacterium]